MSHYYRADQIVPVDNFISLQLPHNQKGYHEGTYNSTSCKACQGCLFKSKDKFWWPG